ncbi:hypothetical protein BSKO_10581 [Bryopsis sp. KO-2023]|nr:hypothetical protein BSKO_10581 [Bryopsis sp. KO-2023]
MLEFSTAPEIGRLGLVLERLTVTWQHFQDDRENLEAPRVSVSLRSDPSSEKVRVITQVCNVSKRCIWRDMKQHLYEIQTLVAELPQDMPVARIPLSKHGRGVIDTLASELRIGELRDLSNLSTLLRKSHEKFMEEMRELVEMNALDSIDDVYNSGRDSAACGGHSDSDEKRESEARNHDGKTFADHGDDVLECTARSFLQIVQTIGAQVAGISKALVDFGIAGQAADHCCPSRYAQHDKQGPSVTGALQKFIKKVDAQLDLVDELKNSYLLLRKKLVVGIEVDHCDESQQSDIGSLEILSDCDGTPIKASSPTVSPPPKVDEGDVTSKEMQNAEEYDVEKVLHRSADHQNHVVLTQVTEERGLLRNTTKENQEDFEPRRPPCWLESLVLSRCQHTANFPLQPPRQPMVANHTVENYNTLPSWEPVHSHNEGSSSTCLGPKGKTLKSKHRMSKWRKRKHRKCDLGHPFRDRTSHRHCEPFGCRALVEEDFNGLKFQPCGGIVEEEDHGMLDEIHSGTDVGKGGAVPFQIWGQSPLADVSCRDADFERSGGHELLMEAHSDPHIPSSNSSGFSWCSAGAFSERHGIETVMHMADAIGGTTFKPEIGMTKPNLIGRLPPPPQDVTPPINHTPTLTLMNHGIEVCEEHLTGQVCSRNATGFKPEFSLRHTPGSPSGMQEVVARKTQSFQVDSGMESLSSSTQENLRILKKMIEGMYVYTTSTPSPFEVKAKGRDIAFVPPPPWQSKKSGVVVGPRVHMRLYNDLSRIVFHQSGKRPTFLLVSHLTGTRTRASCPVQKLPAVSQVNGKEDPVVMPGFVMLGREGKKIEVWTEEVLDKRLWMQGLRLLSKGKLSLLRALIIRHGLGGQ